MRAAVRARRAGLCGLLVLCALVWPRVGELAAQGVGRLRFLTAIYLDDKGVGMRQPEGVACNDKGSLVVADTGRGRLLRFAVEERSVKAVGEVRTAQIVAPIRVQMNSRDEVFALDGKLRRIGRFDARGEFAGFLAPEGVPAPASIVPRSLKLDRSDAIYVLDVFGARVLVLDPAGKYQRHIDVPEDHGFFSDLAVDAKGSIYLLDSIRAAVHVAPKDAKAFTPLGKGLRASVSFPTSLTVDSRGVLYVVDEHGGGVVLLGQDGAVLGQQLAMGWNEGLLYFPAQICLNDKGQVFIADRGNSRVQAFAVTR